MHTRCLVRNAWRKHCRRVCLCRLGVFTHRDQGQEQNPKQDYGFWVSFDDDDEEEDEENVPP